MPSDHNKPLVCSCGCWGAKRAVCIAMVSCEGTGRGGKWRAAARNTELFLFTLSDCASRSAHAPRGVRMLRVPAATCGGASGCGSSARDAIDAYKLLLHPLGRA